MKKEIFDGAYVIYDDGRLWSNKTNQFLKGGHVSRDKNYLCYCITMNGKGRQVYAHRLVAENFVPNPAPEDKTCVNHIDGNTFNNRADNLEWVSHSENTVHAYKLGLIDPIRQCMPCQMCGRPTRAKDEICPACKQKLKQEVTNEQKLTDLNDFLGSVIDFDKITQRQKEIIELRMSGFSLLEIANVYGVSRQRIEQIINAAIRTSSYVKPNKQMRKERDRIKQRIKRYELKMEQLNSDRDNLQKEIDALQEKVTEMEQSVLAG